ncbi:MAG: tetratricopeptide repeat protein, partial [Boseongicola sp.]
MVAPFGTGHIAVRTLSAQTRSPNDLASLAMMAAGNGNWTEAARRWCDCLDQAGGKVQANWLEGYVQALIALERLDDAGLICNRLSYEFANAPESAVCLARLATKLSNWHSADRHWRDASNLLGERIDPSLLREHAGVLAKLGRFHEAETICRSVLARNRTDPLAAAALARIAAQRGSFREAIDLWHTILDQNKRRTRPNWWWELARCHMALQQWHQADEIFDELINCWPEFLNGYEGRARCAMKQQNWAEAARRWRDTLTRFEGRCSPASRGDLGLSLLTLNRLDAAQKVYRDLADEFSDQPVGHAGLANVAARRNDWRTSVDCWRSATTATGGKVHDGNLVAYARALRSIGMFERSDGILQEIIDRRPEWEMGWIELAKNAMVERKMDLAAERWEAIALRFRRHAYHDVSYEQHRAGMFDGGIEIEERPRKRVDTPDDAIQHIANVRTFRAGLIPFLATQTYARRFPDSEFIQISAMQEMKVNIRTASDLDRYLNMSAELCNRFPDSRRLAIFRGMALVAADRVDEVQ